MRPPDLLHAIQQRVLVGDGAMGTRLQALTGKVETCIDALNVDADYQEIVRSVHRSYVAAGADLVLTNTYGANAVKMLRYGLEKRVAEVNRAGARLAREAVGPGVLVGGSVGPLEVFHQEDMGEVEMRRIYAEQIAALVEGGVDFLCLETFQDLREAASALKEARTSGLPVVLEVGGVHQGRTGTGADVREFALMAERLGADLVGCNCRGAFDVLETTRLLARACSLPLSAMPNAGYPEIDRGRVVYNAGPRQFRDYAVRLAEAGAVIIGGCCGTVPGHIREIAEGLKDRRPPPPRAVSPVRVVTPPEAELAPEAEPPPNVVEEVFRTVDFIVSVEMRPSRQVPMSAYLAAGKRLAQEGVHLFDVPDNAGATVSVDPAVAAHRLQAETCIPCLIHLGTSHRNLVATQSYLLGVWNLGVQAVLAVTGDHPNVGDHDKYAERVNDVKSSVNLMRLIGGLNQGRLFNQAPCVRTNFVVGGGFNPCRGLGAQVKWLKRKLEAGARFVYTQPLYQVEDVDRMLEATEDLEVPILVGLLPITSRRNAEFFAAGKIPGIVIPPWLLERFEGVEDAEEGSRIGLDLTLELLSRIQDRIRGIYIIPPFGKQRYEMVSRILAQARRCGATTSR